MRLTAAQKDLLVKLDTSYTTGLSNETACTRRKEAGFSTGARLTPPMDCPAWACIVLPCINHMPSMKMFRIVKPDDAEVLRESNWICYDAASLVPGDIIRLSAGDTVPADCTILSLGMNMIDESSEDTPSAEEELAVDHNLIIGEKRPRSASMSKVLSCPPTQLLCGGMVLEGSCIAVVTAVGNQTLLASLIRKGKWPVKGDISNQLTSNDSNEDKFVDDEVVVKESLIGNQEAI